VGRDLQQYALSSTRYVTQKESGSSQGQILRTHVFRGSTEAIPSHSTHRRRSLQRTRRRFHLDGFCIQCCSFSTDLVGKANFWSPFAFGRLRYVSVPVDNGSITYNKRLILFISLAICCIASFVEVSSCTTLCEDAKAYPEPSGSRPLTLCRLIPRQRLSCAPETSQANDAYHS
jgi:hypothetical protein